MRRFTRPTATIQRWTAVIGVLMVIALYAGTSGMANASTGRSTRPAVDYTQRLFSVTAAGTQKIDWGFAWKAKAEPVSGVTCVWKWDGSGSQSLTFGTTRQRTLLQVFSGHPTVVAFTPQHRRTPWVTGKQVGEGDTSETITGPEKYCGKPTQYSRKDCGKTIKDTAPGVQLNYLTNARGAYIRRVGITVPGISENSAYLCPFLDGSAGALIVLQDVVPVNIFTMSFSDSLTRLLGLKRGHSQSFEGTTLLQAIKGWEKSMCTILNNTLPGSGSCTVKASLNWRIRLVRIS